MGLCRRHVVCRNVLRLVCELSIVVVIFALICSGGHGSMVRLPPVVMSAKSAEYIAPLQDAVDLEIATAEERSLLEAWNKYRVLLNRVDTSTAPDIEWPTSPAE
ncbi:hypothetical protein GKE20_24130 [Escherichia coli]|nr:hypothetical protein [Escherichia coli]